MQVQPILDTITDNYKNLQHTKNTTQSTITHNSTNAINKKNIHPQHTHNEHKDV